MIIADKNAYVNKENGGIMKKHILLLLIVTTIILSVSTQALALLLDESEGNDTYLTAQDIDSSFSISSNLDVFDTFGLLPTVSISGSNGAASDVDYYSFTVASAGMIGYFDIDDVTLSGNHVDLETALRLFNSSNNMLAADPDFRNSTTNDPGSVSSFDSFLGVYKFSLPGTYYIAVSFYDNVQLTPPLGPYLPRPDCWTDNTCNPNNPPPVEYNGGIINSIPDSIVFGTPFPNTNINQNYTLHVTVGTPVPEPSTALLFGLGIITLIIISRTYILPVSNKK